MNITAPSRVQTRPRRLSNAVRRECQLVTKRALHGLTDAEELELAALISVALQDEATAPHEQN